ncbi:MAG: hypothetical protein ACYSR9_06085 [Planctomycetota bacterium]|jgi:hypothetical protein
MNNPQQLKLFDSIKDQLGTKSGGNNKLVEHGIQNEESDYRIHVCYLAQHVYIFPTQAGQNAVRIAEQNNTQTKTATQAGVNFVTGKGYAIPVSYIDNLKSVLISYDIFAKYPISKFDTTSVKGHKAMLIVVEMLKRSLIPLPLSIRVIEDKDLQIKGGDITIHSRLILQVKCDYKGGDKKHNHRVTGNLFLQIAECNPKGLY